MQTTTVISGDVHARLDKARELYQRIGMIECPTDDPMQDVRNPGFVHVQLGDSVSLGYAEVEAEFYRWYFDVVGVDHALLGNHELPAVWWDPDAVMFLGYHDRAEVADPERRARLETDIGRDREADQLVRDAFGSGRYQVAHAVGEWLVTHAGLSVVHEAEHGLAGKPAHEIADYLNAHFAECLTTRRASPILDSRSMVDGGIMWLRIEHLVAEYGQGARSLPQIVGHSGYMGPELHHDLVWDIDTPQGVEDAIGRSEYGGVAALMTRDDGRTFELEYVP